MTRAQTIPNAVHLAIRVRPLQDGTGPEQRFTGRFRIGRDETCEISIQSGLVSRVHAEIVLEDGMWWVQDAGSTNGTYLNGKAIERACLEDEAMLQFGLDGPQVIVNIEYSTKPSSSIADYVEKYFGGGASGPAGDHTMMVREAYAEVHRHQTRRYTRIIGSVVVLCVIAAVFAVAQHLRAERLADEAAETFYGLRNLDVQIAQLQQALEGRRDTSLTDLLTSLENSRRESREAYEAYVEELGVRRKLTPEEQVMYRVARVFNESDHEIPATFVREVKAGIEFWQTHGRSDLAFALKQADQNGYTGHIVRTLQQYGLPPQFFYLALQESKFDPKAVGPATRFGYAKGMWQFIPETAERYGLQVGTLEAYSQYDAQDERHDVERATGAAARYLLDIYATLAKASGLLVIASYNWGEHRVAPKLARLLDHIPDDPKARSYWRFYGEYSRRMPEETKDYVIKIFSAAVIGENPRLFGFDFDNPLAPYTNVVEK